jgi:hypothetical protein
MKSYYGNQNRPRYEYTLDDLAYVREKARQAPPDERYGYECVAAMIERRLGIVTPEAAQS